MQTQYRLLSWCTIALALFLFGCGRQAVEPSLEPSSDGQVTVRVIDEKELAAQLAQLDGKVVLVDFWATWCPPCVALFPHSVELQRRFGDRGLQVISVSLDDPQSEPSVLRFLKRAGATFPNFISRYGLGSRSVEAFDIPEGAIPHLKLYDRQGKLKKTFGLGGESLSPDRIHRAVEELLATSTTAT